MDKEPVSIGTLDGSFDEEKVAAPQLPWRSKEKRVGKPFWRNFK